MTVRSTTSLATVILAAGASTRMGRPKLLLPWAETTIIGHLIRVWQALGADEVAIVCRAGDMALNHELDRLVFPVENRILNPRPEQGMFSSIRCAANWEGWGADLTSWAVVLGDQPHLRLDTLRALVAFQQEHADSICQPAHEGHGAHPVILPREAFLALGQTHAVTLRQFLEQTSIPTRQFLIDDPGLSLDLDRPEDYRDAQNFLHT